MRAVRIGRRRRREGIGGGELVGVASGRWARSANEIARSVPATRTVPSAISRSPGLASSASAASFFRLSASFLAAPATEAPPHGIELDPPVPAPVAIRSVSPWTMRTRSGGRPSCSATICA